jgi:predicted TIM-barrel fold metal-dependent hydrolase
VSLRGGSYAHTVDLTRSLLARLSPSERHHVLTKTAARVYRLAFAAV